jgi:hypothetical protein
MWLAKFTPAFALCEDIHAAPQSQPATLGGSKGICPIWLSIQP